MNRPEKWKEMVKNSRESIEDFNDFTDDRAIIWADNQLSCYKEAMMALVRSNSGWAMTVTDEQEKLINTMVRRADS